LKRNGNRAPPIKDRGVPNGLAWAQPKRGLGMLDSQIGFERARGGRKPLTLPAGAKGWGGWVVERERTVSTSPIWR